MPRKLVIELSDGSHLLGEVQAHDELQLQERLKSSPELLPLDELGLVGPPVVVGRETSLPSGSIDLVLLCNGGDLTLVEFKTGPQNPDFRKCLAQLIDYGSDLWGMTLEAFEAEVAQRYFKGPHCPPGTGATALDEVLEQQWGKDDDDAVDWRERLQRQLRDGSFHYVAVAQRFTPPMLRSVEYLNATMRAARFSAVELIRFEGESLSAFEARFVAGASWRSGPSSSTKALAGAEDLLEAVLDDEYRHVLRDLFDRCSEVDGLAIYWGTTGCSLRVPLPGRAPLSVGWVFPPGPPSWMGLRHLTLGWYEDANGLSISDDRRAALEAYLAALRSISGGVEVKSASIKGLMFEPAAVMANADLLGGAVREVSTGLQA